MKASDYIAIAKAIKDFEVEAPTEHYGKIPCIKKHMFVGRLCDILKADNPNFSKEKFLEACK